MIANEVRAILQKREAEVKATDLAVFQRADDTALADLPFYIEWAKHRARYGENRYTWEPMPKLETSEAFFQQYGRSVVSLLVEEGFTATYDASKHSMEASWPGPVPTGVVYEKLT